MCVLWVCGTFGLCQLQLELGAAAGQLLLQLKDLLLLRLAPALQLLHLTHTTISLTLLRQHTVMKTQHSYFIHQLDFGVGQVLGLSEQLALSECTVLQEET